MKKLILITGLLGIFLIANAQREKGNIPDKRAILERLSIELLPQTKDYNPYKYHRENFIIDCLELRAELEHDNCELLEELIENFYNNVTTFPYQNSVDYISHISRFRCQEAYDFLETQIKKNLSETVRCSAIVFLAWSLSPDYLPCILEYAKKEALSAQEKLALGGAFMIYGVYTSNSELKELSIKFLDEVCYDQSLDIYASCDACYLKLGGNAAINFYTSQFEQQEGARKVAEALTLAELGEFEKTFPVFVEAINSEGVGIQIIYAIKGLAIIGTEEALRLIERQMQSKNEVLARQAKGILGNFNKKGREE